MAHHRCTSCKQESYPRHKWYGGVYCDSCIKVIRGGTVRRGGFFGWVFRAWDIIASTVKSFSRVKESPKQVEMRRERAVHHRLKLMETRARSVPINKSILSPQKI